MIKQTLLLAAGLLLAGLAKPALADLILPGRCHMGYCFDHKFVSKTLLQEGRNSKIYAVELASRSWEINLAPPTTFDPPETYYVHCSTRRPAFISNHEGTYSASLLNPGGDDWYGYNVSHYPVYWATCHNFVGPDFFP